MARDVCYYDGACGFCTRSAGVLRSLDWLGRLHFTDMLTDPDVPVPLESAMSGMPMRTGGGRVLVGFPAIRRALVQTPIGALPAALLYVPGVSHVGRLVYEWVARNRVRRGVACGVEPPSVERGAG